MEEEQLDEKRSAKRGSGGAAVLVVLIVGLGLLPLVYTLSIGPVILMVDRNWIGKEWMPALETTYWPLEWTSNNVPIVGPAIMAYAEWWQDRQQATPVNSVPAPVPVPYPPPPPAGTPLPGPAAPGTEEMPAESPTATEDTIAEPAAAD